MLDNISDATLLGSDIRLRMLGLAIGVAGLAFSGTSARQLWLPLQRRMAEWPNSKSAIM